MADRYERAPWGPGYVIKYVDTGLEYNGAPLYVCAAGNSDNVVSPGLAAVYDSDSYRIAEIEAHTHTYENWFGDGGQTLTPLVIDSASNDWGAWVEILATTDTPYRAGMVYYDLHQLLVTAAERDTPYRVQIAFGADADVALAADVYTEVMFAPNVGLVDASPIEVLCKRQLAGVQAWARCWNAGATGTLSFFVGIHEYEG